MHRRPLIGVPAQTLQATDGIPRGVPHSWMANRRYFAALTLAGMVAVMVPLLPDEEILRAVYERVDGVFLAGGADVEPSSYAAQRHDLCGSADPDRDRVELLFSRWAMEEGKPLLGVCRGMQVINVAAGGSLLQDCAAFHPGAIKHDYLPTEGYAPDYLAHEVRVEEGSRLAGILGGTTARVNSMHHQGVERLGEGLVASAHAPDGLVEALEARDDRFVLGVQWHPEAFAEADAATRHLFEAFGAAAGAGSPV